MRKLFKKLTFSLMLCFLSTTLYPQELVVEMLSGNLDDAEKLAKAYLEPFGKSFGTSLNNGWYTTAKPHKLFGFDFTIMAAMAVPPSGDKTFDVSKLNLSYWELQDPANKLTPSVTGDKKDGVVLTDKEYNTATLTLPQGENLDFIPAPIIQLGFGLPLHTEVVGRFFPKIDIEDLGDFSLWGIGIKNEFKEFIPGFKLLPIDVSLFFGYTEFKSSFDISGGNNQTLEFKSKGYTSKLLISKSLTVLTVYAGVGYSESSTDVSLKGNYVVNIAGVDQPINDPLKLDFSNDGFNTNVGLRLKLTVIAFHFDYSFGKYAIYNAGVGINFR